MSTAKPIDASFAGRHALILGYGRSGRAATAFLQHRGSSVRVVDRADTPDLRRELDAAGIAAHLGGYGPSDLNGTDLLVVSPGVAWDEPLVETARQRGIEVSSEIDLFFRTCPSPIVGITGTNGKTTTTALVAEVLAAGGLNVMRGGNIGEPVLDRVDQLRPDAWVVLELSSFQLESITSPRLHIGAVLNVTPDHLDRHKSFERYAAIKARAVAFMQPQDHALLNADDSVCLAMRERTRGEVLAFAVRSPIDRGTTVENDWLVIRNEAGDERVMPVRDVPLPGEHNLSNVLAAIGAGEAAGLAPEPMAQAIRQFKAVEHRLELVGRFSGVRWYNDSKATNPDSTYKALAAFSEPIVLIAGGRNKGIDLEPLAQAIAKRATALVAMGETGEELARRVRDAGLEQVERAADLRDAIRKAAALAAPGSVVLLSPAFTSYDMFENYEDRGRRFKSTVLQELGG
ncbi:MAG: UDP-N-acetylmuramoyl-L-alanine--D-glutamate ligase [Chloroflexi bacterium]|nr:MAG: UDP-N-acetylmuramoyl-L-alanine--D-glutamate ligase [Chloroflexota bacterium]TME46841.1 MAG: UDP-N-acetylmuramoyl-L-alanine--D-glutamate ligase [Chloroflexota bacterium]